MKLHQLALIALVTSMALVGCDKKETEEQTVIVEPAEVTAPAPAPETMAPAEEPSAPTTEPAVPNTETPVEEAPTDTTATE